MKTELPQLLAWLEARTVGDWWTTLEAIALGITVVAFLLVFILRRPSNDSRSSDARFAIEVFATVATVAAVTKIAVTFLGPALFGLDVSTLGPSDVFILAGAAIAIVLVATKGLRDSFDKWQGTATGSGGSNPGGNNSGGSEAFDGVLTNTEPGSVGDHEKGNVSLEEPAT